jgi:WD40 repeat protein
LINRWEPLDTAYIHDIVLDGQNCPIAIVSDTQTLALWDIEQQAYVATCAPDDEPWWHVSPSPDGQSLICARQNGDISLWSVPLGQPQGQLRIDRPYEGMQIGGCLGLTESERQMLYSLGASDY